MVTMLSKRKPKAPKKVESKRGCFGWCISWLVYPLPTALFFMIVMLIWSSSATYISGRIVHVCISSRKLSNLYCVSATTQPNAEFQLPFNSSSREFREEKVESGKVFAIHALNDESVNRNLEGDSKDVSKVVVENSSSFLEKRFGGNEISKVVESTPVFFGQRFSKDKEVEVTSDLKAESKEVAKVVVENPTAFLEKRVVNESVEVKSDFNGDSKEVAKVFVENPAAFREKIVVNEGVEVKGDLNGKKEVAKVVENPSTFPEKKVVNEGVEVQSNLNRDSKKVAKVVENFAAFLEKRAVNDGVNVTNDLKVDSKEKSSNVFDKYNPRGDSIDEIKKARVVVEEQLQIHRSWITNQNWNQNQNQCEGRGIYVYELPTKFNKDLVAQCHNLVPWADMCKYFSNNALGEAIPDLGNRWFRTHQYSLEQIFHSRVLNHPCRVYDENKAKLFYVPYYGGLDILRWHFKNVTTEVKDSLSFELINWLEMQKPWDKNLGKDHVFVLGKISWDFRRKNYTSWGTKFLELDEMKNPMKLMIERQPWELNDIGIPHPTHFHPHSDEDIRLWQRKIISSSRPNLVSFAGAARPGAQDNIRSILIDQCTSTTEQHCKFFNCNSGLCDEPQSIIGLFTESEFCLQPPGDSPTRKSVFDSLISGCIPVMFDPFTAYYQYPWHLPENHGNYSVFIDQEEVKTMKVNVVERLMKVPIKERDDMRRYIVYEMMPKLVYGDKDAKFDMFQDAFSITINNLFERVKTLNLD